MASKAQELRELDASGENTALLKSSAPLDGSCHQFEKTGSGETCDSQFVQLNYTDHLCDADRIRGKTFSEVLMDWLLTEDNHGRWFRVLGDSIARDALCDEVIILLNAQGIEHRTARSMQLIHTWRTALLTRRHFWPSMVISLSGIVGSYQERSDEHMPVFRPAGASHELEQGRSSGSDRSDH